MKRFQGRLGGGRCGVMVSTVLALLIALVALGGLRLGQALAADPTPQGVTSYVTSSLLSYSNLTATAGTNGLAVVSPGFAIGDCYNNIAFANATVSTATVKVQSSVDNVNWVDTVSFTDTTTTTEMARVVLYGTYTRAIVASLANTSDAATGSVQCKFANLK